MKTNAPLLWTLSLILFLSAACSPKAPTPDPNTQIRQAIAATLAAIPTATYIPPSTPYPTPTPFNLAGLYCEYQFCIGHPSSMAFYDVSAQQNPAAPSAYSNGFLAAYLPTMVITLTWLQAPGTSDPKFLLDTILEDQADTQTGTLDVKLIRGMNVIYTPITTTISSEVPFGSAAAWTCGDRVFAWKVYTPQAETSGPLFEEALSRFTCGQ
jgi:hypothetical protein